MNQFEKLIESNTILSSLPSEIIKSHIQNRTLEVISFQKNSIVHFVGDKCNQLEIILKGTVVVERIDESGDLLTIAEFYQDDILGGNLLFSNSPYYPMTTTTREESIILVIEKNLLFDLLSEFPTFLKVYLEFVSDHTFILGDKIKHYVNKTIRECILNYLAYESKLQNSNQIQLGITKKELADRIGVQRTSLSRELSKMRDEGIIDYDRNSIKLIK